MFSLLLSAIFWIYFIHLSTNLPLREKCPNTEFFCDTPQLDEFQNCYVSKQSFKLRKLAGILFKCSSSMKFDRKLFLVKEMLKKDFVIAMSKIKQTPAHTKMKKI